MTPLIRAELASSNQNQALVRFGYLAAIVIPMLTFAANSNQESEDADTETVKQIQQLLKVQSECWNDGDIDGFMQGYWKSEQLTFSGGGTTTRGWQATLDRYREKYPPEKMGNLKFSDLEITMLADSAALVLGNWHLEMKETTARGNFSLVLKKTAGDWKIIHDHSSKIEESESS